MALKGAARLLAKLTRRKRLARRAARRRGEAVPKAPKRYSSVSAMRRAMAAKAKGQSKSKAVIERARRLRKIAKKTRNVPSSPYTGEVYKNTFKNRKDNRYVRRLIKQDDNPNSLDAELRRRVKAHEDVYDEDGNHLAATHWDPPEWATKEVEVDFDRIHEHISYDMPQKAMNKFTGKLKGMGESGLNRNQRRRFLKQIRRGDYDKEIEELNDDLIGVFDE